SRPALRDSTAWRLLSTTPPEAARCALDLVRCAIRYIGSIYRLLCPGERDITRSGRPRTPQRGSDARLPAPQAAGLHARPPVRGLLRGALPLSHAPPEGRPRARGRQT